MTDYLYSLSLAQQTRAFLLSLGFGFIMGIIYDAFRIVRLCISKGRAAVIISDLLYCIIFCFCSFLFVLSVNEGEVRLFIFLGEAAGFASYYFSLGAIVFSVSEKIIAFLKKIIGSILRAVLFPFKWFFGKNRKLINAFLKKSRKNSKKLKNKSNFLLKVNRQMLYNLNIRKKIPVDDGLSEEREA